MRSNALPEHLRDALWRIETARAATMEAPAAFVCGMGGSAIGGDLAIAALADRLTKPMLVARGYELPRGRRQARRCSARAIRATRKRLWPATRQPRRWAPSA